MAMVMWWGPYVFRTDIHIPEEGLPLRTHIDSSPIGQVFRREDGRVDLMMRPGWTAPVTIVYIRDSIIGDHFRRATPKNGWSIENTVTASLTPYLSRVKNGVL